MSKKGGVWKELEDELHKIEEDSHKSGGWFKADEVGKGVDFDTNIWLRECKEEVIEPIEGQTTGEIPKWLNGALIRNGPGKMSYGSSSYRHLFDFSALLHRFSVKNGAATYQCRFLNSNTYKKNMAANRIIVTEFGTKALPDPCHTIFQRFSSYFHTPEASDNCNVSIYPMSDEYYAFAEYPSIYRIDPVTLEALRRVNVQEKVNVVHHTSHPHVVEDGTMYNVGLTADKKPAYSIVEFPKTKKNAVAEEDVFSDAQIVGSVSARWPLYPGYMHSFGITKNYYIVIEQPLCLSVPSMWSNKVLHGPPLNMLKWFNDYPTLFHVVSRETGNLVKSYSSETFFFMHTINQYEEDGHIVFDVCVYKDAEVINSLLIDALQGTKSATFKKSFVTRPARFVLPLEVKEGAEERDNLVTLDGTEARAWKQPGSGQLAVSPELLSDSNCEMPRVKYPELCGKKYRYFYAIILDMVGSHPGGLVKVDTQTKTEIIWYEEGTMASEPIFIPAPESEEEDDGVVLSSLLYTAEEQQTRIALLVLDAKTFKELGRTVFDTPSPVPFTFHGWFSND